MSAQSRVHFFVHETFKDSPEIDFTNSLVASGTELESFLDVVTVAREDALSALGTAIDLRQTDYETASATVERYLKDYLGAVRGLADDPVQLLTSGSSDVSNLRGDSQLRNCIKWRWQNIFGTVRLSSSQDACFEMASFIVSYSHWHLYAGVRMYSESVAEDEIDTDENIERYQSQSCNSFCTAAGAFEKLLEWRAAGLITDMTSNDLSAPALTAWAAMALAYAGEVTLDRAIQNVDSDNGFLASFASSIRAKYDYAYHTMAPYDSHGAPNSVRALRAFFLYKSTMYLGISYEFAGMQALGTIDTSYREYGAGQRPPSTRSAFIGFLTHAIQALQRTSDLCREYINLVPTNRSLRDVQLGPLAEVNYHLNRAFEKLSQVAPEVATSRTRIKTSGETPAVPEPFDTIHPKKFSLPPVREQWSALYEPLMFHVAANDLATGRKTPSGSPRHIPNPAGSDPVTSGPAAPGFVDNSPLPTRSSRRRDGRISRLKRSVSRVARSGSKTAKECSIS